MSGWTQGLSLPESDTLVHKSYGDEGNTQSQDDSGRFTSGTGGDVQGSSDDRSGSLGETALREGGFTVGQGKYSDGPKTGWMVSLKGSEATETMEHMMGPSDLPNATPLENFERNVDGMVAGFTEEHDDLLSQEGHFLGGWIDEGKFYLDVSVNVSSEEEATRMGEEHDQKAIFNVETGEYKKLGVEKAESDSPLQEKHKVLVDTRGKTSKQIAQELVTGLLK